MFAACCFKCPDAKPDSTVPRRFLYRLLNADERHAAVVHLWQNEPSDVRTALMDALARRLGFRPAFIRSRPKEWVIAQLELQFERPYLDGGLYYLHLHHVLGSCPRMVADVLEAQGTPHEGPQISAGAPAPTREDFLRGIRRVAGRFPDREVCMYFDTCLSGGGNFYQALGEAIECEELSAAFERLKAAHPTEANAVANVTAGSPAEVEGQTGGKDVKPEVAAYVIEGFSQMDQLLLRTMVASALEAEHALPRDQVEALVDEFLAHCPDRHRSWFHPGFLAALQSQPLSMDFPGTNPDRRGWKFAGFLLGTARTQVPDLAGAFRRFSGAWRELMDPAARDGRMGARKALLSLVPTLIRSGLWRPLSELLTLSPAPEQSEMLRIYQLTLSAASELIGNGNIEEAVLVLEGLRQMGNRVARSFEDWNQVSLREVMRRLGQAHMRAGRFPAAIPLLEQLVTGPMGIGTVNPAVDLWLARASLHSISGLLPTENAQADRDRFGGMDDGLLLEVTTAAAAVGGAGAYARLALGLLRFHQGRWNEAEIALSFALEWMMRAGSEPQSGGILPQVRFLLGLAIAESGVPGRIHDALVHLEDALASGCKYPLRLKEAWTRALILVDEQERALALAAQIISEKPPRGWRLVEETGLAQFSPVLRVGFASWIRDQKQDPAQTMGQLSRLLTFALSSGAHEEAESLLGDLESLARRNSQCAERFVELLTQRRTEMASLWDEDSIDLSLAGTLEGLDRLAEAAEILRRAFFRSRRYVETEVAESFLASLEQLQVFESAEITRLKGLLGGPTPGQRQADNPPRPTSVLFVGGNEIQARQQHQVVRRLAEVAPWLRVTLRFPGWASNWDDELEDCKRLLPQFDVVVIHRFVRTNFGRALRAACGPRTPWRSCTGTGRQSLVSAIESAGHWIAAKRG